ncbi:phospholipase D-like domain-containing protein [Gemmatimonas sp.]|uniref:phospholipase D-like domain-containing protein n=1 Tax=Gemmatimonas sp. TaxID=1962908 RepID=UPI00286B07DD|nr:phospholipase D-like domain-containing protein [Gemmatimonas sp.]
MADVQSPREVRTYRAWGAARRFTEGVRDPAFRDLLQLIDGGPLHGCPPLVLLPDGAQAFQRMIATMDSAQEEILLETYIMRDDKLGESVQQALIRAAARGVRTYVLADAVGSMNTGDRFWETLTEHGVVVRHFHRVWHHPLEALRRDHRKILVCDRRIAFTGGMNIAEEYGSSIRSKGNAWRDTFAQVEGSVARELAAVFAEGWDRANGPDLPGLEYVSWSVIDETSTRAFTHGVGPRKLQRALQQKLHQRLGAQRDKRRGRRVRSVADLAAPDDRAVLVLAPRPGRGQREMLGVLAAMIGGARQRLWITTPYFAPPTRALTLLLAAAQQGVDVRLLLPGEHADVPLIRHAAHGVYQKLLKGGVRVFEYQRATLHAKTVVIDGYASLIGSSNLDFRSFWLNAECNVLVFDDECGAGMEASFETDLNDSHEVTLDEWRQRTWSHRVFDRLARALRWAL